jgi:hypothetical protein
MNYKQLTEKKKVEIDILDIFISFSLTHKGNSKGSMSNFFSLIRI